MTDKIMTLHPDGKQGVNIDADYYASIKAAILHALANGAEGPLRYCLRWSASNCPTSEDRSHGTSPR